VGCRLGTVGTRPATGVRIGIDLDDVVAECAVPYLRAFAERYRLDLPDEDLGWQTLSRIEAVSYTHLTLPTICSV